jgi:hypothetical protein
MAATKPGEVVEVDFGYLDSPEKVARRITER